MFRKRWLSIIALVLVVASFAGCGPDEEAVFSITSPLTDTETRSNIVKVEGTVSSNASSVEINGQSAWVDDGAFFAWVELEEGANVIEGSAVIGSDQLDDSVTLTFTPNLAVFLDYPSGETFIDYRNATLEVNGFVNKPEAVVKINGQSVIVGTDGFFAGLVELNETGGRADAVAVLGDEIDSINYPINLDSNGAMIFSGSDIRLNVGNVSIPEIVLVERGAQEIFTWTLDTNKSIRDPQLCHVKVVGDPAKPENDTPLPAGLSIEFFPKETMVYPNSVYLMEAVVTVTPEMNPGICDVFVSVWVQEGYRVGQLISIEIS